MPLRFFPYWTRERIIFQRTCQPFLLPFRNQEGYAKLIDLAPAWTPISGMIDQTSTLTTALKGSTYQHNGILCWYTVYFYRSLQSNEICVSIFNTWTRANVWLYWIAKPCSHPTRIWGHAISCRRAVAARLQHRWRHTSAAQWWYSGFTCRALFALTNMRKC